MASWGCGACRLRFDKPNASLIITICRNVLFFRCLITNDDQPAVQNLTPIASIYRDPASPNASKISFHQRCDIASCRRLLISTPASPMHVPPYHTLDHCTSHLPLLLVWLNSLCRTTRPSGCLVVFSSVERRHHYSIKNNLFQFKCSKYLV